MDFYGTCRGWGDCEECPGNLGREERGESGISGADFVGRRGGEEEEVRGLYGGRRTSQEIEGDVGGAGRISSRVVGRGRIAGGSCFFLVGV